MDSSLTFYLVLGALLVGFIVLGMLKGMIKMLLFGAAVLSAVAAYFWLSKYGFTYLSFITSDPREWMVTVLSVGGAAAVFFIFMHGLFWFSDVFSWGRRMGFGGAKGIVTTILMAAVVCWVGVMCIFYYGSMAEMTRARELALYHMDPSRTISLPAIYSVKKSISAIPAAPAALPSKMNTSNGAPAMPSGDMVSKFSRAKSVMRMFRLSSAFAASFRRA